jgi:hypothetical protein
MSLLTDFRDAVRDDTRLDTTTAAVAFVLSTYMNGDGMARPARATLARGAKLRQARSVDRALRILEEVRLVAIDRSRGRRASVYVATPSAHAGLLAESAKHLARASLSSPSKTSGAAPCTVAAREMHRWAPSDALLAKATVHPDARFKAPTVQPGARSKDANTCLECGVSPKIGHADWCPNLEPAVTS